MRPWILPLVCLAACTSHDSRPASVVIDTLPGGIPEVTSSAPAGWSDSSDGWRFVEVPPIAPPAGSPGELINPAEIAVDAARRVYVVDKSPTVVKQYDASGNFIRTIGREGDGPGEYRDAHIAVRRDRLLVHDASAERTSLFDTSGAYIRSFHSVGRSFRPVALDAAGRAVLPAMRPLNAPNPPAQIYVRFDSLGTLLDTIMVPRLLETPVWTLEQDGKPFLALPMPFAPTTLFTFGSDSGLVYGATNEFSLFRSAGHGDTIRVWRRPWTPAPLADSLRQQTLDQVAEFLQRQGLDKVSINKSLHLSDLPTSAPAFYTVMTDDIGLTYTFGLPVDDVWPVDVFDAEGIWLGTVARPISAQHLKSPVLSHGVLAGVKVDENGLPEIGRWVLSDGQDGQDGQVRR